MLDGVLDVLGNSEKHDGSILSRHFFFSMDGNKFYDLATSLLTLAIMLEETYMKYPGFVEDMKDVGGKDINAIGSHFPSILAFHFHCLIYL